MAHFLHARPLGSPAAAHFLVRPLSHTPFDGLGGPGGGLQNKMESDVTMQTNKGQPVSHCVHMLSHECDRGGVGATHVGPLPQAFSHSECDSLPVADFSHVPVDAVHTYFGAHGDGGGGGGLGPPPNSSAWKRASVIGTLE